MERLMLLEHTTPKESRDGKRCASGGGTPGGVDGRGRMGAMTAVLLMMRMMFVLTVTVSTTTLSEKSRS
jgi:hypothetical protein